MKNNAEKFSNSKIINIAMLLLILNSSFIVAQWNIKLGTDQEYNSNPFRSVNPNSDFISTFDIGIEKEFENFNILYFGSYTKFMNSTDIDYYWHQLGLYNESESIIWGAYFEQRFNKAANNYYDYLNYAGYIRKPFKLFDINFEANVSVSSMNYTIIPDFDNWVGSTGLLARKSFETKTTLIGSVIFNYKGFKNFSSDIDTTYFVSEAVNISQIVFNGRVAQSITENTGIAFNFNSKNILSGSGYSASLIESTYGDMELYDDPVSQEGYSFGGMLTQMLPSDISLKIGYTYSDKLYPSQGIYLSETEYNLDVSRKDYQNYFSTSVSKPIYLDNESGSVIDLKLNYYIIKNQSNSYFFNYNMNTLSFTLNYLF